MARPDGYPGGRSADSPAACPRDAGAARGTRRAVLPAAGHSAGDGPIEYASVASPSAIHPLATSAIHTAAGAIHTAAGEVHPVSRAIHTAAGSRAAVAPAGRRRWISATLATSYRADLQRERTAPTPLPARAPARWCGMRRCHRTSGSSHPRHEGLRHADRVAVD
jgi:hypothetical protein